MFRIDIIATEKTVYIKTAEIRKVVKHWEEGGFVLTILYKNISDSECDKFFFQDEVEIDNIITRLIVLL